MTAPRYDEVEALINSLAGKYLKKMRARGCSVEFDDLKQEAAIVYHRAVLGFDADRGVKFTTYLWRAIANHYNRMMDYDTSPQTSSLDEEIGDDGDTRLDFLQADQTSALDKIEANVVMEETLKRMSRDARQVALLMIEPTPTMLEEHRRMTAFAQKCAKIGASWQTPRIDPTFIMRALGYTAKQRRAVTEEFATLIRSVHFEGEAI